MYPEIQLVFVSCLIVYVSCRTTISPEEANERMIRRILRQEELGLACGKTCRPEDYHSTCHAAYGDSCTEFITCDQKVKGNDYMWIGTRMSCSHGTFFSQETKQCQIPELAKCRTDRCFVDDTLSSYASTTGCRTYWECIGNPGNRISVPKCCPVNSSYSEQAGGCVENFLCDETCNLGGVVDEVTGNDCPDRTRWGPGCNRLCSQYCVNGECDPSDGFCKCVAGWTGNKCDSECTLRSSPNSVYKYLKDGVEFSCGEGTIFAPDLCTCDKDPNPKVPRVNCRALVYTNFTQKRWYGIKNWQGQEQVDGFNIDLNPTEVIDGQAQYGSFNGNSYALIYVFGGNSKVKETFGTRIVFRPDPGQTSPNKQILLSNCYEITTLQNANAPLEISIIPATNDVVISSYTKDRTGQFATESFTLKYDPNSWNILDFLLKNKRMMAKTMLVNQDRTVIDNQAYNVKGEMLTGSNMHIGKCDYSDGFKGKMAEITIALCDPGLQF